MQVTLTDMLRGYNAESTMFLSYLGVRKILANGLK